MTDHYVSMAQIRASKKLQKSEELSFKKIETSFVEEEPYSEITFGEGGPSVDEEEGPSVDGDVPSSSGVSSNSGQSSQCNENAYVEYMPVTRKVVLHPGPRGLGISVVGGITTPEHGLIPVIITDIDPGGEVDKSQVVKVGDRIVSVNGASMEGKTHGDVVLAIKAAGASLIMEVTEGQQDIRDYISKELSDED
ncbi:protein lin-7 homolog C-like [Patiria miniata]|uniref:PDZ domain-containing protein n=1 Tax=Patiria miniata TaxID=46514 RepID=A0A914AYB4_PATMI|nr:protein lin-7 homolog C-like [Patiria miniata]